ncbi:phosphate/phosphite/phosphonate ABC transporter substrate-binding protein [Bacillus lacus]|uniref:Phosphate/phosphite/phosphonate ABC transporter substrate-binding protein n=1 Tax=Metabacillus lacus TaxID=1983721 RepID=A0A7X2J207_9BACI|nr:phosphate/phosphite/phosphonate ABC transporter substrate-binding protein [Metabacillus lacus]MRX73854.1 phosphate/phosphite/phosphonate ABC transporter substrate-binding protein [Metabacillus lacus]
MKKIISTLLIAVLAISLAACGTNANSSSKPEKIIMGFVPSQESDKIADTVKPLADKLSEELGVEVEGQVMTNYTALVEAMGSNKVHIGFIPAFGYVLANEKHGVNVILKSERNGSGTYKAQYVVKSDSGIESLEDLRGKTWAYADATSTSGYLFPAAQLMEKFNVENLETDFFGETVQSGSHDNAAIAVLNGDADVATTFDDVRAVLEKDYPEIMDQLTVIDYTDEIPNDTISVTKDLDEELVNKIKETFLSFNNDEEMIEVMQEVYSWNAIIEAQDSEYSVVKETYNKFKDDITLD